MDAATGSLVSVPFHGRTVKGWVLGPASEDVPAERLRPIRKLQSRIRFFDDSLLALFRWISERYIAPLSTVIERSHPPRVVGEEATDPMRSESEAAAGRTDPSVLRKYAAASMLDPGRASWFRPLPGEEVETCVAAVASCLSSGRQAIVLVPEADPLPTTAAAVLEAWPGRAVAFLGGDARARYRTWLDILGGAFDVVVGTRPAVFAPLSRLGLLWMSREVHPGHREDRAPYYHVRDVAMARARIESAACVVAGFSPSVETAAACRDESMSVLRPDRALERDAAPLVETTPPDAEDRSTRLGALLKTARSAALIVSRRGYGVARVCKACGMPAACGVCSGPIILERGKPVCRVCSSEGRCTVCGSTDFGIERGGVERVAEWAARIAGRGVAQADEGNGSVPAEGVVVGTAATVKDVGRRRLDLVAILDPDRALSRPGVHSAERAVATWMEAAAWAGRRGDGGRVLVQTRHPGHPAVQALVRWDPVRFLEDEAERRTKAGFEPLRPLFRMTGTDRLADSLGAAGGFVLVSTAADGSTVCLVSVSPEDLPSFRRSVLQLAVDGVVDRVEAEPQL